MPRCLQATRAPLLMDGTLPEAVNRFSVSRPPHVRTPDPGTPPSSITLHPSHTTRRSNAPTADSFYMHTAHQGSIIDKTNHAGAMEDRCLPNWQSQIQRHTTMNVRSRKSGFGCGPMRSIITCAPKLETHVNGSIRATFRHPNKAPSTAVNPKPPPKIQPHQPRSSHVPMEKAQSYAPTHCCNPLQDVKEGSAPAYPHVDTQRPPLANRTRLIGSHRQAFPTSSSFRMTTQSPFLRSHLKKLVPGHQKICTNLSMFLALR